MKRRRPYRRWVTTLGTALLAGGVAVMYNVSFVLVVVAAISAMLSQLVTRRLGQWGVSAFFCQMAAASLITIIATFTFWLRSLDIELPGGHHPTVIMISGIIRLLSGIGLTCCARARIEGTY